jgi:uncharacterized lipoprotein YajG
MKKIFLLALVSSFALASCTKDITSLNNNPKAPLTAPSASVFVAGEKALVDLYTAGRAGMVREYICYRVQL